MSCEAGKWCLWVTEKHNEGNHWVRSQVRSGPIPTVCYRDAMMSRGKPLRAPSVVLIVGLLLSIAPPPPASAQVPVDDAASFAKRIVEAISVRELRLEATLRPDARVERLPADRDAVARSVRELLSQKGIAIGTNAAALIRLTFSEQLGEALWVAEIVDGNRHNILVFRPTESPIDNDTPARAPVALVMQPIFQREAPILDLVIEADHLFLLGENGVSIYEGQPGQWKPAGEARFSPTGASNTNRIPRRRDPRGKLRLEAQHLDVWLPFMECHGDTAGTTELSCEPSGTPWSWGTMAAAFVSEDNAFHGPLLIEWKRVETPPFFAAAHWNGPGASRIALAGRNGAIEFQSLSGTALASAEAFGDELAVIEPVCGGDPLLLVSSPGDATEPEWLRAVTLENGQVQPRGTTLELPGRLTALWPTQVPARALAIVKDEARNNYVALYISAVCSQ